MQPQQHQRQQLVALNRFGEPLLVIHGLSCHLVQVCQYRAPFLDLQHQYQPIKIRHHIDQSELQRIHPKLFSCHDDESLSFHMTSFLFQPSNLKSSHLANIHEVLIARSDHHEPHLIQLICALVCHDQSAHHNDPHQYQRVHQSESSKLFPYLND